MVISFGIRAGFGENSAFERGRLECKPVGITELIVEYVTRLMDQGGYGVLAILMALESMVAPVPSEAVMPFAGFLIVEGRFTWLGVTFFSSLGSFVGSAASYFMGLYGGKPFVKRFGRYLLLDEHHLELTERFFARFGEKAVFISRFVPVVRHLISIPAGVGRMNFAKFTLYTVVGATLWNLFLAWVGFALKENWGAVGKYMKIADVIVIVGLVAGVVYFVRQHFRRARQA